MFPFYRRHTVLAHVVGRSSWIFLSLLLVGCGSGGSSSSPPPSVAATGTPGAEADVGERLFVDTRFAQAFKAYLDSRGNVNDALPAGDPVMDLYAGTLRNGATQLQGIALNNPGDGASLVAFLRSLNEDYQ